MPGSFSPSGKVMPRSTISHCRASAGPEAVEVAVHADLADAAERHEDELVCRAARCADRGVRRHQPLSSSAPSRQRDVAEREPALRPLRSRSSSAPSRRDRGRCRRCARAPVSTVRLRPTGAAALEPGRAHRGKARAAVPHGEPALHGAAPARAAWPRGVDAHAVRGQMRSRRGRDRRDAQARLMPMPITATTSEPRAADWLSASMPAHLASPISTSLGHLRRRPATAQRRRGRRWPRRRPRRPAARAGAPTAGGQASRCSRLA